VTCGLPDLQAPRHSRMNCAPRRLINNSRESYRFPFDGLLPPEARQEEVFDRVAQPVLRSALDGYNGTVFAFGQTGSGKTFTITGGAERYADRGLIPRAISALFAETAARGAGGRASAAGAGAGAPCHASSPASYSVHVSYMEIYNEAGFDLLEPGRQVRALEDLPRVRAAVVLCCVRYFVVFVLAGYEAAAVNPARCQFSRSTVPSMPGAVMILGPPYLTALPFECTCAALVLPCPAGPHPGGRRVSCALPQPLHAPLRYRGAGAQHGGWAEGRGVESAKWAVVHAGWEKTADPQPGMAGVVTPLHLKPHTHLPTLPGCCHCFLHLLQLFLGDTNRVVAETPLNQASSRSHCVFTLHIEARAQRAGGGAAGAAAAAAGEAVVRRSKLHFVDLAGSERVGKTGLAAHAQLREAKYINLSLHFLEQVKSVCVWSGMLWLGYCVHSYGGAPIGVGGGCSTQQVGQIALPCCCRPWPCCPPACRR
jgi:hypothetical protein